MKTSHGLYLKYKMRQIVLALVLVGAINWGATAFGYNLVEILHTNLNSLLKMETYSNKIIYILVALAAIKIALRRDSWLPFLGYSVLPGSFIPLRSINGDVSVNVKVRPNTKVAYWASSKVDKEGVPDVKTAYGDFSNSGVVMSDANGIAKLVFNKGTSYIIPSIKEIPRHVHYREIGLEYGMMGNIETEYY